jgi:single-strand DNA-binding protein
MNNKMNGVFKEDVMNNLNSVLIEGNLVRDPVLRSTSNGNSECTFTLASDRFFKKGSGIEKETGCFDVEAWDKLAQVCGSQGRKGRGVRVVGRLKQKRWTGTDGKMYSHIIIVAEHVEFRPDNGSESITEEDSLPLSERFGRKTA